MEERAPREVGEPGHLLAVTPRPALHPLPRPPMLLLHGFGSSGERNWVTTGWVRRLNDAGRNLIMVDLPAHGNSAVREDAGAYAPSRMRAGILQAVRSAGVLPLTPDDPTSGVDIIGYSLGARLAWEFGAAHPELVRRMVLGGPGTGDPLAAVDLDAAGRYAAGGPAVEDPATADLLRMALTRPGATVSGLLPMISAIKAEPFDPWGAVPSMPLLLVAGERDGYAAGIEDLAAGAPSAEVLMLPGRTHADAVTSRGFKDAALAFVS